MPRKKTAGDFLFYDTLVTLGINTHNLSRECPISLRNDSNQYIRLKRGHFIGRAEEVTVIMVETDTPSPTHVPGRCPLAAYNENTIRQVNAIPKHIEELWKHSKTNLTSNES
jgi:hypothetical protein